MGTITERNNLITTEKNRKLEDFIKKSTVSDNSPFLGCFIADKNGKTLFKYEIYDQALDYFIKRDYQEETKKKQFDIELIPMFISALERFSNEINLKNVPGFKLNGSNLSLHSFFCFDDYSVIFLLRSDAPVNSFFESRIKNHFKFLFEVYGKEFSNFRKMSSINFIKHLQLIGNLWLKNLNDSYNNSS